MAATVLLPLLSKVRFECCCQLRAGFEIDGVAVLIDATDPARVIDDSPEFRPLDRLADCGDEAIRSDHLEWPAVERSRGGVKRRCDRQFVVATSHDLGRAGEVTFPLFPGVGDQCAGKERG